MGPTPRCGALVGATQWPDRQRFWHRFALSSSSRTSPPRRESHNQQAAGPHPTRWRDGVRFRETARRPRGTFRRVILRSPMNAPSPGSIAAPTRVGGVQTTLKTADDRPVNPPSRPARLPPVRPHHSPDLPFIPPSSSTGTTRGDRARPWRRVVPRAHLPRRRGRIPQAERGRRARRSTERGRQDLTGTRPVPRHVQPDRGRVRIVHRVHVARRVRREERRARPIHAATVGSGVGDERDGYRRSRVRVQRAGAAGGDVHDRRLHGRLHVGGVQAE